jgi:hypothetical protein
MCYFVDFAHLCVWCVYFWTVQITMVPLSGFLTRTVCFISRINIKMSGVDISDIIRSNTDISGYIQWNPSNKTYTVQKDFKWTDLIATINNVPTVNYNSYITLGNGETFDGQGYAIDISSGSNTWNGLFTISASPGQDAIVQNLGILNGTTADDTGFFIKGGQTYFIVSNCYSTGTIGSGGGGIAGQYAGSGAGPIRGTCTITNCYSTGTIGTCGGGIVGNFAGSNRGTCTITNCYSTGPIGNTGGGIAGYYAAQNEGTCTITNCYSTGPIGDSGGGIVGSNAGYGGICTITNCYSTGTIGDSGGGIAGFGAGFGAGYYGGTCTITNCYSTGQISSNADSITANGGIVGSFAGFNGSCIILGCVCDGDRIAGFNSSISTPTIPNSNNLNDISGALKDGWSGAVWKVGDVSTVNACKLPILKAFQTHPWQNEIYQSATDRAQFAFNVAHAIKKVEFILTSPINSYIRWDSASKAYTVQQNFYWSTFLVALGAANYDSYITLFADETFNGQGYTITLDAGYKWNGLFRISATKNKKAVIMNTAIEGGKLEKYAGYFIRAAQTNFLISNCHSTGHIDGENAGGIAGHGAGEGIDSKHYVNSEYSYSTIDGECIIEKCYSTGDISGNATGGIVGYGAGGNGGSCTIKNCYSTGKITAEIGGGIAGASVGKDGGYCKIYNCYSTGNIHGNGAGGIVGDSAGGSTYSDVKTYSTSGYSNYNLLCNPGRCEIESCYSMGDISGNDDGAGGIAGSYAGFAGVCSIKNCYTTGNITGENAGGIAGTCAGCPGYVDIDNQSASYGYNVNAICEIDSCYSIGTISGTNAGGIAGAKAGGGGEFVGNSIPPAGKCYIKNCVSNGQLYREGIRVSQYPTIYPNYADLMAITNVRPTRWSSVIWFISSDRTSPYPYLSAFTRLPWDSTKYAKYDDEAKFGIRNPIKIPVLVSPFLKDFIDKVESGDFEWEQMVTVNNFDSIAVDYVKKEDMLEIITVDNIGPLALDYIKKNAIKYIPFILVPLAIPFLFSAFKKQDKT